MRTHGDSFGAVVVGAVVGVAVVDGGLAVLVVVVALAVLDDAVVVEESGFGVGMDAELVAEVVTVLGA